MNNTANQIIPVYLQRIKLSETIVTLIENYAI